MRGNFGRWGAACLAVGLALAAPATAADYGPYLSGDPSLPTPGTVQPALLLMAVASTMLTVPVVMGAALLMLKKQET